MHRKEENLTENHTTPIVSEIHTKQSINEVKSSLFMNSIFKKGKNKSRNLKSEKSKDIVQKPQWNCTFLISISVVISQRDYTVRSQSYVWRLPKYWPGECVPPPLVRGEDTCTRWVEKGVGGQYFGRRETCETHTALYSTYVSTLSVI
jgi:hypothetical protein